MTSMLGIRMAAVGWAMAAAGCAQATTSTTSPSSLSYTASQAEEGGSGYDDACVACHLPDLSGSGDAPALAGPSFARRWEGRPVAELIRYMREHMPRTVPGVLNDRTYLAVLSYVLARNGIPAGENPLTTEATATILIGSR